jgi:hypothetical protein
MQRHKPQEQRSSCCSFNWELLDHPAHSPDLTPSDFHLFLHLMKHLASQKFHKDEEVETKSLHGCMRRRQSSMT